MKKSLLPSLIPSTFFLSMMPTAAFAHPGAFHVHNFASGMAHPLSGLDHILAMVAVGLWAAQKGGRALWIWPAAFVGVMLIGGFFGMEGVALPMIEPMIATSIMVLGLLIAGSAQLPLWAGAAVIGLFALFHGNAHGLEAPADDATLLYALGFALSMAFLHGVGLALGLASQRAVWPKLVRAGGLVTAGIGGILLFAPFVFI